jgi:hypothetical protein
MSALLEYQCRVPVDGYEIITIEEPEPEPDDEGQVAVFGTRRFLQPRSERSRSFDLFKVSSSAYLEFAQTPDTPDAIKDFADRYGALTPDVGTEPGRVSRENIRTWSMYIQDMKKIIELWTMSMETGDFGKIIRTVQKKLIDPAAFAPGVPVQLLLKEDPLSGSARLCIRPDSLLHALYSQVLLAIDGNVNLGACVQCRKWFTLDAGQGRSDKQYCSNACRMRAYRKRKTSG